MTNNFKLVLPVLMWAQFFWAFIRCEINLKPVSEPPIPTPFPLTNYLGGFNNTHTIKQLPRF